MSDIHPIAIADGEFYPGQSGTVEVVAGQLPSGNPVQIKAHVFRAYQPGPTVLFLGGVHGDEINGVEIIRRCLRGGIFKRLETGTVIAIPLLNIYGFNNFSRDVPDGKDVNRSFPGTKSGSLASRIAHGLSHNILTHVNLAVDFHTGGRGTYNYPQIRYNAEDLRAAEAAEAFAPPLIFANKAPAKSLRRHALKILNVPVLTFEGGENLRYDAHSIDVGVSGIARLLHQQGMLTKKPPAPDRTPVRITQSTWIRASRAGLFQWTKRSGFAVRKGEAIGIISDPQVGRLDKRIYAPRDGFLIGHANAAVVSQGDALFHIGE
ncbi:succinylglutamate desuccinylase/aspartoacylase family protein [Neolewinella lacunae]|uniref:succinylglutamate desuccinylase/aspartoacylase family protein n=1 Tax=Neolewinella lacunae TaxID=1517758 RepID=UPI001CA46745|nr:succinylglutamate desuccinylase/aspartoacylase family protein [Neolewinella lacunae]MDN3636296.1 succinylglutamate desuccinylase/aspartoacylase family protein [Neolewinella lacunae]